LELLFPESLVVIDPIDKLRNVASPVRSDQLQFFAAASRAFLEAPSEEFFFPKKVQPLTAKELQIRLEEGGFDCLFLIFKQITAVSDILWGQLYKTQRSLRKMLEVNDFKVIRDSVFSRKADDFSVFIFELDRQIITSARKHQGPPLERKAECESFLSKYTNNSDVLAGPYIEEGRWFVHLKRKNNEAATLLKAKLKGGGKGLGVAELVSHAIEQDFKVLVGIEIKDPYFDSEAFSVFLTEFLCAKPFWLNKK
jgi:tRNA nucleotidyltransferase (CCA-adding enzyme)